MLLHALSDPTVDQKWPAQPRPAESCYYPMSISCRYNSQGGTDNEQSHFELYPPFTTIIPTFATHFIMKILKSHSQIVFWCIIVYRNPKEIPRYLHYEKQALDMPKLSIEVSHYFVPGMTCICVAFT